MRNSVGPAGRVQGIGEQEQAGGQGGVFGGEHAGLAAAIGMTAEEDAAGGDFAHGEGGIAQSGAVEGGIAGARRTGGARLPEGEVAPQDEEAGGGKRFGGGQEEGRAGVGAGAMREHERTGGGGV